MSAEQIVEVRIGCPDHATANAIAAHLVTEGLAAAAHVLPPHTTVYRWRGEVVHGREHLVAARTRTGQVDAIVQAIRDRHPWQTPAVVAVPVYPIAADYRAWVIAETR